MGWLGVMAFDSDEAMDWASDVFWPGAKTAVEVVEELRRVLRAVLQTHRIDVSTGTLAIAAAEIVAACTGRRRVDLPENVDSWVAQSGHLISAADARLASQALHPIVWGY